MIAGELSDRFVAFHRSTSNQTGALGRLSGMSSRLTFISLFLIGASIALIGDAAHVQAGITEYLWDGVPVIWKSAIWFPLLVGSAIAVTAWIGSRFQLPVRRRDRSDALIGAGLILALYCLTTVVAGAPSIAANGLCWGIAVAIWLWWDDSPGALVFALIATLVGPLAEIVMVELGASRYTEAYDGLFGVAPWLMPLYFATGAVLSGIFRAFQNDAR